jgi:hypothetical protein
MARDAKGRFLAGPDPGRHQFTQSERIKGFWAMLDSIYTRYPDAVLKGNGSRHIACYALPYLIQRKGGESKKQIRRLDK